MRPVPRRHAGSLALGVLITWWAPVLWIGTRIVANRAVAVLTPQIPCSPTAWGAPATDLDAPGTAHWRTGR